MMLPRQRVISAINFDCPDVAPLRIKGTEGGLRDHGQKLLDLIKRCGHDFGDLSELQLPPPTPPEDFDTNGNYHALITDDWGTTWERRLFDEWGHPVSWPLNDLSKLDEYKAPAPPPCKGSEFQAALIASQTHRKRFYQLEFCGAVLEKMHSLRRFEDVLIDITLDTPEINRMADMIVENVEAHVRRALSLCADGCLFSDDFGTQQGMLISPDVFRRFFKPRYEKIFAPVLKTGKDVFFHSCGKIDPILKDLSEVGVKVIWPQLPAYDTSVLARKCRELGLAVELHPDRGDLMQKGKPSEVREYVSRMIDMFSTTSGGSWLYIEIDPGFLWPNVEALFETAIKMRRQAKG